MDKLIKVLVGLGLILVVFAGYRLFFSGSKKKQVTKTDPVIVDDGLFRLASLPPELLLKFGNIKLEPSIFENDPVLLAYEGKKKDLYIYQVIKDLKPEQTQVQFNFSLSKQSLPRILNQYGLKRPDDLEVEFKIWDDKEAVAKIDGKAIRKKDIEKSSFHWGALETDIFLRKLKVVKEKLFSQVLTQQAKSQDISTQKYIEEFILKGQRVSGEDQQNKIEEFLRLQVLDPPLDLALEKPHFDIELKPEWTVHQGPPEASQKMIVFDSFKNQWTRDFLKKIDSFAKKFPETYFGFRPVFFKGDQYQQMIAEAGYCLWSQVPEKYFAFMKEAVDISQVYIERDIYKKIEEVGVELAPMKKCIYERPYKEVVQYHQEYAQFLGIKAGPVIFYKGMVYTGGPSMEQLERFLKF